jgi:hypothetical protein
MGSVEALPAPPAPAGDAGDELLQLRPPWPYGDLRPTWRSVVVCALLPVAAGLAGLLVPFGAEIVALVAVVGFVLGQVARVPTLAVAADEVRVDERGGGSLRTIPVATIADLELVDDARAQALLAASDPATTLDSTVYAAHPPEPEARHPAAPAGLLVTTAASGQLSSRRRRNAPVPSGRVLLPVWRPQDGVPLLRSLALATGRVDADVVARTWPDPPARAVPERGTLRSALRRCAARVVVLVAGPALGVAVVLQVLRLVRAATLDAVLGTGLGTGLVLLYRGIAVVVVAAAATAALTGVLATVAWDRVGQHVAPADALRLGWRRARWLLWQLRVWLAGVAALLTVTGVGMARFALAAAAASVAIPLAQGLHDLVRQTVEEASMRHPPALRRVAMAHQWLVVLAVAGVVGLRNL